MRSVLVDDTKELNERRAGGPVAISWPSRVIRIATIVLGAVVLLAPNAGAITYSLRGYVVGNGGGIPSGASNRIYGTLGQAAIGKSGGTSNNLCHGFWCYGGSRVLAVDDPPGSGCGCALPTELSLSRAYPNPSRDNVRFELALPKSADVRLSVYDVSGRRVDQVEVPAMGAGYHTLEWRATRGKAGVYFTRVYVGGRMVGERRIVMMR